MRVFYCSNRYYSVVPWAYTDNKFYGHSTFIEVITMYKNAIVRKPGNSLVYGISTIDLGDPDVELALKQHANYVDVLQTCGVDVTVLEADEDFPDSTFVEDAAILLPDCAIITRPGALSRRGEIESMEKTLSRFYSKIERIEAPGTIEGGDVLNVGNHFYIGLSERTNAEGAAQLIEILKRHGCTGSQVEVEGFLHLKTAVAYLENNIMLVRESLMDLPEFQTYQRMLVDDEEGYAANCVWVNGTVLVPTGFPKTRQMILDAGFDVLEVNVSEFRKLDGGLSCLSLRR